ncbi:MAG: hypothetical protein E7618_06430 [Ruminococcaceae bacterium]|nr:hypothetical protein [Oscillospiraceae bacterium]
MKTRKKSAPLTGNTLYLLLLLLFCLCLNAGLLAQRAVEYRRQYNAAVEEFEGRFQALLQHYVPEDLVAMGEDYSLLFSFNGEIAADPVGFGGIPAIENNTVVRKNGQNGLPYLVAVMDISETEDRLVFCLIRDLSGFDHDQEAQNLVTVLVSFASTALLILGFALITKRSTLWQTAPVMEEPTLTSPEDIPVAEPEPRTDLGRLAASLLSDMAEEAEARGIALGGSALPHSFVAHNEQLLSRLLETLLRTAIASTPENGTLTLSVFRRDTLMLTITTNGSLPANAALIHRPKCEAAGVTMTSDSSTFTLRFITAHDTEATL